MTRKNITWFGFKITQKQSVFIFILSIIGLFITIFLLMTLVSSLMMSFMYYEPYYYPDNYIFQMIISMLPYILILTVAFFMCLYSLIQSRKIAKNYSDLINPVLESRPVPRYTEVKPTSIAQFCPNCGKVMKGNEKFCTNCGQEIRY
ncbi:MAG: zinc-ribbon domain-containing protein [Candidatus Lokiarchaeota archaeon]|nr:zinc-ribbon domain-containing protein [Candidatus Lokiarchaeota archaeon]